MDIELRSSPQGQRARRQAAFLNDVSALEVTPQAITQVLLRRHDYCRLVEIWRKLWTGFEVRLETAALEVQLESVPDLYELWGSVSALSEILAALVASGYRVQRQRLVRRRPEGPMVELVHGGKRQECAVAHHACVSRICNAVRSFNSAHGNDPTLAVEKRSSAA